MSSTVWYARLAYPGALLRVSYHADEPEIRLFGNLHGVLSLAVTLHWLIEEIDREFLSLRELPFARVEGDLGLCFRAGNSDRVAAPDWVPGRVVRLDKDRSFEWDLSEDEGRYLVRLLLNLVTKPWHEYDILGGPECGWDARVHVRLVDARLHSRVAR